jgi:hypothetical protein
MLSQHNGAAQGAPVLVRDVMASALAYRFGRLTARLVT